MSGNTRPHSAHAGPSPVCHGSGGGGNPIAADRGAAGAWVIPQLAHSRHISCPQGRSFISTIASSSPQMWQASDPFGSWARSDWVLELPPHTLAAPHTDMMRPWCLTRAPAGRACSRG